MQSIRILVSVAVLSAALSQSALAQNKAAMAKTANDFYGLSSALTTTLGSLSKRAGSASPNDKEMLKLVNAQLSLVDATTDGVLALGMVAAEMRDASDLAAVKKQLATRCTALKSLADGSAKYVAGLAANIAAVATAAEVNKAQELLTQISQHALCGGAAASKK